MHMSLQEETRRPVIEMRDVRLSFGAYEALRGVSMAVRAGERVLVCGPSGSGKSTLLRCLVGLETPGAGEVHAFGLRIDKDARALRVARLRMAFIFQSFNLFSNMTAAGNVSLGLRRLRGMARRDADAKAREMLGLVQLAELADKYPFQLSGGQRQRVAIARALATEPDVLLLDEPTSALDPELVQGFLELLRRVVSPSLTVVCATHELGLARRLAQRIAFMAEGRIVEEGPAAQLLERPSSERLKAFLSSATTHRPASSALP